jgi:hypothetical protein
MMVEESSEWKNVFAMKALEALETKSPSAVDPMKSHPMGNPMAMPTKKTTIVVIVPVSNIETPLPLSPAYPGNFFHLVSGGGNVIETMKNS